MTPEQKAEVSRILHELGGACSVCWDPIPVGVFDSTQAHERCEEAARELEALINALPTEPQPEAREVFDWQAVYPYVGPDLARMQKKKCDEIRASVERLRAFIRAHRRRRALPLRARERDGQRTAGARADGSERKHGHTSRTQGHPGWRAAPDKEEAMTPDKASFGLNGKGAWRRLVERFADGRSICNCREAYLDEDGRCAYGCSANLIRAKYEIARRIEEKEKP